jgi:putative zinc finger/helix-turn-helix YgiT family protein
MNCYQCGGETVARQAKIPGEYAGEKFNVETESMVCPKCGHVVLHASQIDAFTTKLADAFRVKNGLLTSREIRSIRNRLGMSQEEFAKYLNVGVASVKRWELGKAQDKSSDELIRLKSSLARAEQNVAEILFTQGGQVDEFSGRRTFNVAKLGQVVAFFLQKATERRARVGPLHVNKLCWYADAENYRRYGVSITGARYARLPLGPAFDDYRLVFQELEQRGVIVQKRMDHFELMRPFQSEDFSEEEVRTLEDVWNHFKGRLTQIVDESHQERAWKQTPHARLISFELVQRPTWGQSQPKTTHRGAQRHSVR